MSNGVKFIYFGSSRFSEIILEGLYLKGYIPVLVVSRPDKPQGRGLKFSPTAVSEFSTDKNIPLVKPSSLKEAGFKEHLRRQEADFFVVADYGKILPSTCLSLPNVFALCAHPSLLPRYRGPAPIEQVLINGDKESGVTIFKMNQRVDAGDIILQKALAIGYNDDFFSLSKKMAKEAVLLLIEAVNRIDKGNYSLSPQDEKSATLTVKLKKEDGRIIWDNKASDMRNLIRATLGWPSAYTYHRKIMLKVLAAEVIDRETALPAGTISHIGKEGISVAAGEGILTITRVKPQGKGEMSAWSFACGYRVKNGELFSEQARP